MTTPPPKDEGPAEKVSKPVNEEKTEPKTEKTLDADQATEPAKPRWLVWLEKYKTALELVGAIAVVGTLIFTAITAYATKDAVQASTAQIEEAKYESVYGHQLDLWNLAAGSEDLAPYIVGGKRPDPDAVKKAQGAEAKAKAEALQARQNAALFTALDFNAYVFSQLAPRFDDGTVPPGALMVRQEQPPQWGMTQADWDAWATWAATIKNGFRGAPGMCNFLDADAYETELVDALHEARLCV
jgi:hypothetical protein